MPDYLVTWTIDITADTPLKGARLAHKVMLDEHSAATCFVVEGPDGGVGIDLEDHPE